MNAPLTNKLAALTPASPRHFNVEDIRKDFPILAREIYDKPLVYLDNAASAQKPVQVISAITKVMETEYANVHRGLHYLSNAATDAFEAARQQVQKFLNAKHLEEIVFTAGATDGINLVAQSYLEPIIQPGDEIILSVLEHHSNIVPWHFLRERYGAVLKWVPADEFGNLDMDVFHSFLNERTKLVAITQMSNALGTITPVAEIITAAHKNDIPVLVDGCQGSVHLSCDMQEMDCDFYVMSGHKLYGPSGVGVLYAKHKLLETMRPYRGGGEMIREVHQDHVTYADAPHKFEAGTPPIIEVIALGAAVAYMMQFTRSDMADHEAALGKYGRELLAQIPKVKILGPQDASAILAFTVDSAHPHDVATFLDRSGVAVRAGHHCAQPLMRHLGVPATARASFAIYNTREEVDIFAAALEKTIGFFG